jgi:antitoxin (DNA-binding transcriptional repressor) of toxin-antitoxin stability system
VNSLISIPATARHATCYAKRMGLRSNEAGPAHPSLPVCFCDAKMCHMRKASVRDLRYAFKKIERLLHQGEEIQITKRRRVIARLVPESGVSPAEVPDFLGRLRAIYGDRELAVSGAEVVSEDRNRY